MAFNSAFTPSDPLWSAPPEKAIIGTDEVHVWRVTLQLADAHLAFLRQLLSPDEKARADRFVFSRHRDRFIIARGFLRLIVSSYLDCSPVEVAFTYDEYGKPSLLSPDHRDGRLNFNLAHSEWLAICAITVGRLIGVDIEQIRNDLAVGEMARGFFSADEASRLFSLPPSEQRKAFYDGWTRKEAFIKAIGTGLSLPLDQFDVTLTPGEPAAIIETRWDHREAARWSLRAIDVAPGYAACIAVERNDLILKCWQASEAMLSRI